jgi:hypothetical protein
VGAAHPAYVLEFHAGTEFDQTHALSALQPVAHLRPKYDSSRQQAGNLLEDHHMPIAFHVDDVLLVLLRGGLIHRVQELPALVANLADHPCNRRSVHVNVENAQKDADTNQAFASHRDDGGLGNLSISG